jgi:hypothetical protein
VDPIRRIEAIKCSLDVGEEGAAEIRAAARTLEALTDVGEVLAVVADPEFPSALIAGTQGCAEPEESAWLTLAAAGARRARQVLAWRASQLVDSDELAAVAMKRRRARERGLEHLAASAEPSASAAWALLAHLQGGELRAMVRARPALAAAHRRARGARRPAPALRPALS